MNDTPEPRLPLTVPLSLWTQMARAVSPAFADSYLSGARLAGDELTTRTRTAFDRLKMRSEAGSLLNGLGIKLVAPITPAETINKPWTHPSEDELSAMSLRERQRQFRLMASDARTRAGFMEADGSRAHPEWIPKAENYEAEVKRLGELIAKGMRQAAE